MSHFRIVLAYDGTDFVGWQRQASGVSIQGLIEDALSELDGRPVAVAGAGRTDAGVHALGQVAGFSLERSIEPNAVLRALNARLPDAVRVLSAGAVDASFHPRFSAREKRYEYRIWNAPVADPFERRYAWHIHDPIDVDAMHAAAAMFEGRHDFAAFQSAGSAATTTVRTIFKSTLSAAGVDVRGGESGRLITYEISGDGFLRHMVRAIVGTLVEVGRGRRRPEWIGEVIASADRGAAGPTAPPDGLFLVGVSY
jgi:tRNA pseudouridine38-40 synthase